jgi:signal transduction histidine kinase
MNARAWRRLRLPWQGRGLRSQLALAIAAVGLLSLLLNVGLGFTLLSGYLEDRQGQLIAEQAAELGTCCKSGSFVLAMERGPNVLANAMRLVLAGTPQRHAIIVDVRGQLLYYTPNLSRQTLRDLIGHLKGDMPALTTPTSPPHWQLFHDQLLSEVVLYFPRQSGDSVHHVAGALLLADDRHVAGTSGAVLLVAASGFAAVVLAVVGGVLAASAITRPVRALTAAARGIARGDYGRRVSPSGPAELRRLARTFNTMVEEVVHQRAIERDLLANVSHELAAPLGIIHGYAEALSDDMIVAPEQRRAAVQAIRAETKRLSRLSGDLLDLALLETKQVSVHPEPVPVSDLLAGLRQRFDRLAREANVALLVDAPDKLPVLYTDGLRLEQVLVNLITNAIRHTLPGGTITLRARPEGDGLRLEVADTGHGIPAEDLARIWERFYQVDKGRDRRAGEAGVGLGLAICRSTVTLLGGRIDARSTVGKGTTFTIYLPWRPPAT